MKICAFFPVALTLTPGQLQTRQQAPERSHKSVYKNRFHARGGQRWSRGTSGKNISAAPIALPAMATMIGSKWPRRADSRAAQTLPEKHAKLLLRHERALPSGIGRRPATERPRPLFHGRELDMLRRDLVAQLQKLRGDHKVARGQHRHEIARAQDGRETCPDRLRRGVIERKDRGKLAADGQVDRLLEPRCPPARARA